MSRARYEQSPLAQRPINVVVVVGGAANWRPPAESTLSQATGPDLHSRQYAWTQSDAPGLPGLLPASLR